MFERFWTPTPESTAAVDRICAAARAENRAAGARLAAIGDLHALRSREHERCEGWSVDTTTAVSAEVAAALAISEGLASSYLYYARALRTRLPQVGQALLDGDIGYLVFQAIVHRTDLIADPDIMAAVDTELAAKVRRWPSMTRSRLNACIDRVVARRDPDAVRRRRETQTDRELSIWDTGDGLAEVFGRLVSTDARGVDARLDAIASTVCAEDPRTRNQRRADALGALAAGADRLGCRCGRADCPAGDKPAPGPVVVHVIAEQASMDGTSKNPGALIGSDALIPAELLAELAAGARLRPMVVPVDAPPEPGYRPSKALADFVRCRDLTCRFPGCDHPATDCDLDHTVPYGDGGPTHASNLKCQCRIHHLLKTFWGWRDKQLPDGTVIWAAPSGHTYVTTPGSALLFPALMTPTGNLAPPEPTSGHRSADRTAMMPRRRHTRAENRTRYVTTERRRNRAARQARHVVWAAAQCGPAPPAGGDGDPPPF
ncbi:MAG TPA: HNH endonuclease signature motif containing protein [Mycobacterium sp.]|nr:HNH endonuclease signature motif containing protein [Mycobacterium sp.]